VVQLDGLDRHNWYRSLFSNVTARTKFTTKSSATSIASSIRTYSARTLDVRMMQHRESEVHRECRSKSHRRAEVMCWDKPSS
jgi:hypothetical protein